MANPRKFSEKIALHNQKQAEETAAFEAVMREVSGATRQSAYQKHLHISQNLGAYRGGSLPNVNQMGTNSIDLQSALHNLEDMKQGRLHRERARQITSHRRQFPFDKRVDCSPYGTAYLSPPPDTSWRRTFYKHLDANGAQLNRTNSDSALHTSSALHMTTPMLHTHGGPITPPTQRRMIDPSAYDGMQLVQSRPKSCEVPNINIYPSQDPDSCLHIPISNNTGSLPDLTNINFPSPLATPLDADDQSYPHVGSPTNLSPTSAHHMGGMVQQAQQQQTSQSQQQSPVARRRQPQGGPRPLVLSSPANHHMRLPLSPPDGNVDPSRLVLDPRIRQQYMLYAQQQQQQQRRLRGRSHEQQAMSNSMAPPPAPQQVIQQPQVQPQIMITSPSPTIVRAETTEPSMTQYRNSTSDTTCQSPSSPLSQPSFSPAQSPGLPPNNLNNSPFTDAYYIQQQQQQTNSLQHQFEQFNMLQENPSLASLSQTMTTNSVNGNPMYAAHPLNYSPTTIQNFMDYPSQFFPIDPDQSPVGLSSPQHAQLNNHHHLQHLSPGQNNKIPDIVLTGADDPLSRQDFAKDLGNAITGMLDGDLFPSDEALKADLDPLDFDELQMLTDPNLVADPAVEDTFRLDRL